MNLYNIIEEIEKVDPDFQDRLSPRRDAIKNITSFGSKVAVAAMPFALGTLFKKAYGAATTSDVIGVLNFALTLEYLESSFYNKAMSTGGLILDSAYITPIQIDENAHVKFLQTAITGAGGTPVDEASLTFDFTGGGKTSGPTNNGPFSDVFSNYQTFLAVAETFEDTGVRAYKGQAPALALNPVLTYALDIHAVEARHASAIRYLRTMRGYATVKPWINSTSSLGNDTGVSIINANYDGEQTTTQLGVDITKLPSASGSTTSVATATAAFDEPLTKDQIVAILIPAFIQSK
jgi:hypothetical protein